MEIKGVQTRVPVPFHVPSERSQELFLPFVSAVLRVRSRVE